VKSRIIPKNQKGQIPGLKLSQYNIVTLGIVIKTPGNWGILSLREMRLVTDFILKM
jgi:hypothetical protein